ncbi:MAG: MBL fold metallo-hydrolase [Bacteroidales bacterium]|nr:MBL fold metallo-hydrolase [Bacteroidales bacterium]
MIHIEHFTFNSFQTNSFILWDESGKCAIADPGCSSEAELSRLTGFIADKGLEPVCILLTHCHFDHVYGMAALAREYEIPVYADMDEMYSLQVTNAKLCGQFGFPMPDEFPIIRTSSDVNHPAKAIFVQDGDTIDVGNLHFEVIQTPGHSKGGLCFLERNEKVLLSGDTLFAGAIGRTDHPGGDYETLMKSIFEKLLMLDGDTRVLPGHGPSSDIATERMTNPFLMPFNEPYED